MQIPDFRHYAQKTKISQLEHHAILWIPNQFSADQPFFSNHAAKLLAEICENQRAAQSGKALKL